MLGGQDVRQKREIEAKSIMADMKAQNDRDLERMRINAGKYDRWATSQGLKNDRNFQSYKLKDEEARALGSQINTALGKVKSQNFMDALDPTNAAMWKQRNANVMQQINTLRARQAEIMESVRAYEAANPIVAKPKSLMKPKAGNRQVIPYAPGVQPPAKAAPAGKTVTDIRQPGFSKASLKPGDRITGMSGQEDVVLEVGADGKTLTPVQ
jgi:hypothetical protein